MSHDIVGEFRETVYEYIPGSKLHQDMLLHLSDQMLRSKDPVLLDMILKSYTQLAKDEGRSLSRWISNLSYHCNNTGTQALWGFVQGLGLERCLNLGMDVGYNGHAYFLRDQKVFLCDIVRSGVFKSTGYPIAYEFYVDRASTWYDVPSDHFSILGFRGFSDGKREYLADLDIYHILPMDRGFEGGGEFRGFRLREFDDSLLIDLKNCGMHLRRDLPLYTKATIDFEYVT